LGTAPLPAAPLGVDGVYHSRRGSTQHQTTESIGKSNSVIGNNEVDYQLYIFGSHAVLESAWINAMLIKPFAYFLNAYSEVALVNPARLIPASGDAIRCL
jgi:hypothetical protein